MTCRRSAPFPSIERNESDEETHSGLLSGVAAILCCATPLATAQTTPAAWHKFGRDVLKQLIEINSEHSNGSTGVTHAIADRLIAAGFSKDDFKLLAPADHPIKGNLVVRLKGTGKLKPVLYIGHLDVVEAARADWTYDPYVLTEKDGWLYGRGTIDMKGQDASTLTALIRLKKEGYVPDRDIIVAFTADEEAGGDANGVDWLVKNHRDLVDAEFVINPDSGYGGEKDGKKLYLGIQTSREGIYDLRLGGDRQGRAQFAADAGQPDLSRGGGVGPAIAFPLSAAPDRDDPEIFRGPRQAGNRAGAGGYAVRGGRVARSGGDRAAVPVGGHQHHDALHLRGHPVRRRAQRKRPARTGQGGDPVPGHFG